MDSENNQAENELDRFPSIDSFSSQDGESLSYALIADHDNLPSPEHPTEPIAFHKMKWKRLRQHYNDQYLDLFNDAAQTEEGDLVGHVSSTQVGAVLWQPPEKTRLYQALSRKGRHDLQEISLIVGTKSPVEIKAYLDNLRDQENDRQLFKAQPKNISHAEIPAAIEIGPQCEAALERAADALAAFQEQYDHAVGQRANRLWLIDPTVAAALDQKGDENEVAHEHSGLDSGDESAPDDIEHAVGLFRLSAFLELSERFYMNQGPDSHDVWHALAEEGQRPAMTMAVVKEFYDIILNFSRILVQSCLFVAMSRIRSSTSTSYKPSAIVRAEDVFAALDVSNLQHNAENYWIGMARRNHLTVIDGSHRKGSSRRNILPYDEVEVKLATPRRRRSLSTMSEDSMGSQTSSTDLDDKNRAREDVGSSSGVESDEDASAEDVPSSSDGDNGSSNSTTNERAGSSDENPPTIPIVQRKGVQVLEAEQDEYMEQIDGAASKQEEAWLLQLLGTQVEEEIKQEETAESQHRPKVLRKPQQETLGWSVKYLTEWELDGGLIPPERFETGPRTKRRRIDTESTSHTAIS